MGVEDSFGALVEQGGEVVVGGVGEGGVLFVHLVGLPEMG